ncbi:hypothetical protein CF137_20925 [Aeromonas sobria]|nr:hypothetical protein CF137_20925 [Aeromonas sobria]
MPTITEIKEEATKFRGLIERCDKKNTKLVIECFPIMSCKLSSMLLAYHILLLWPNLEIKGISAATGKNNHITHYWLEINDIAIDITGDQYNIISEKELNKKIITNRPFEVVHVSHKGDSYLYDLFNIIESEPLVYGFPTIGEDFIEDMSLGYSQLIYQATSENNKLELGP